MEIADQTVKALSGVITGDGGRSPYRSGPDLVEFFNQFGYEDSYGQGFPSRWYFAESHIKGLNGDSRLSDVICAAVDPRHYIETKWEPADVAAYLNKYLEYDGYRLHDAGKRWRVLRVGADAVEVDSPYPDSVEITHVFITEQIEKCEVKIDACDYDGAITNARSLLEAVLTSIEREFDNEPPEYDGGLPKLYKRVQKHLNLSPGQENLAPQLRQVLSGMTSIVNGLASLRNKMSDSHVVSYRPAEHHARLAVNSSKTLCRFLFETKEYQATIAKRNGRAA